MSTLSALTPAFTAALTSAFTPARLRPSLHPLFPLHLHPAHATTPGTAGAGVRRAVVRAITRRVSDLRHYPEGTDKYAAREIRKAEKNAARRKRRLARRIPHGFGNRPGLGIFPAGSPRRTQAENEARLKYLAGDEDQQAAQAALDRFEGSLCGGKADLLIYTLRARYIDRDLAEAEGRPVLLSDDIPKLYGHLVDEILLCDQMYYRDEPEPRIKDEEYDELVMHLLELERVFPEIIVPRSPSQNVGHAAAGHAAKLALDDDISPVGCDSVVSQALTVPASTRAFAPHHHRAVMLSLDNAFKHEDLVAFVRRASLAGSLVAAELKVDGVALSLEYRDGRLVAAATRGTGHVGDEVTANVRSALLTSGVVDSLPDSPPPPAFMLVRGEVFIATADFDELNKTLDRPLSNARNAAAGALKNKDPAEAAARRLRFVAYEALTADNPEVARFDAAPVHAEPMRARAAFATQADTLAALRDWGFGAMPRARTCATVAEAEAFATRVEAERAALPMEADGIVFKFDLAAAREAAGHTARAPRGAIAYKFEAQSRVTAVDDVVMQVSRTGSITPVAVLRPVRVGGAVLSRATLHNFAEVARLGVAIGDSVRVQRGGDVIPKVVSVEQRAPDASRKPVEPPACCPACGGGVKTVDDPDSVATTYACENAENCSAQTLGRMLHFAGRDAMDISGLGRRTVEKLLSAGLVAVLADMFRLTRDDVMTLEKFRERSADNLVAGIADARQNRSLERLLLGIGLPGIGKVAARALALHVQTLRGLLDIADDEDGATRLMGVANVAEKTAVGVHRHVRDARVRAELEALDSVVRPERVVDETAARDEATEEMATVSGKSFAFTGKFSEFSRPAAMAWIKGAGGTVVSDVSRKTDVLVVGDEPGAKLYKARRLKVRVVLENELFDALQLDGEAREAVKKAPARQRKHGRPLKKAAAA